MEVKILPRSLKAAVDLLESYTARAWTIDELASACGVSRRTLQRHFRRFIGQTPMDFLRDLRLEKARRELFRNSGGSRVMDIAMRNGFNHAGRFAALYRARYGESPSTTLERSWNDRVVGPARARTPMATMDRPTVAILPFAQVGEAATGCAGVGEEITASLLRLRWLTVRTPERSQYHVRGTVRCDVDGRVRIVTMLLDSSSGRYLWAERWRGGRNDVFDLIERVGERVVSPIAQSLLQAEVGRATDRDRAQCSPWDLTMRALPHALLVAPAEADKALELLEQAMERAPNDALPVALAAWCHGLRGAHNFSRHPDDEKAAGRRLARQAAELNVGDGLTETMLSASYCLTEDLEMACAHADRALELDRGSAWAWGRSAWIKAYRGAAAEAMAFFHIARSLAPADPLTFLCSVGIAVGHFWQGNYDKSAQWFECALEENPAAVWINQHLTAAHALAGHKEQAARSLREVGRQFPDLTIGRVGSGLPYGPGFLDRVAEGLESAGMHVD